MTAAISIRPSGRSSAGPDPWYAPSPYLRTRKARDRSVRIADHVSGARLMEPAPNENDLFPALHTCAWLADRRRRGGPDAAAVSQWEWRWRAIREHIVEANLGLAYAIVGRFRSTDSDHDDLLSEAMYGLARAIDRFNPHRGYRFSTYACNCMIRACMRRGRRERRRRELLPAHRDASWEPTQEESDSYAGLRLERLRRMLQTDTGDLSDLERRIIVQRFPLDDRPTRTFKEIARNVGLSKERVRQIQNVALDKLREGLKHDPLLQ